jgi:hypothetical protein
MKNILVATLALVALIALASSTQAQVIYSVQFSNGNYGFEVKRSTPTPQNLSAGFAPAQYWNEDTTGGNTVGYPHSVSLSNLVDSTGATSSVSYSGTTDGNFNSQGGSSGNGFTSGSGNNLLFSAGSLGSYNHVTDVNSFTLNNLPTGDSYSLIVYVKNLFGADTTSPIDITAGGTSYYINTDSTASTFVQSTATTAGTATVGNYVEFTNLSAATGSLTFSLVGTGSSTSATNYLMPGFQLVDNGPSGSTSVPEPSTYALLGFGLLGMVFLRARGRMA